MLVWPVLMRRVVAEGEKNLGENNDAIPASVAWKCRYCYANMKDTLKNNCKIGALILL